MKVGLSVAALLAAVCACAPPGSSQAAAVDLTTNWKAGQSATYQWHEVTNLSVAQAGRSQTIAQDTTGTETTKVTSVDPNGTATLEVTLSNLKSTGSGVQVALTQPKQLTFQVTRDGRVLPAGSTAASSGAPSSTPGSEPPFAILPNYKVKPGDTWSTDFERPNPLGSGTVKVHADNRYLRDESVKGAAAAVVESKTTVPFDIVVDLAQVSAILGSGGQQALPPQAQNLKLHETGTVTSDVTNWIDKSTRQLLKADGRSQVDLSLAADGLPAGAPAGAGTVQVTGPITVTLTRA